MKLPLRAVPVTDIWVGLWDANDQRICALYEDYALTDAAAIVRSVNDEAALRGGTNGRINMTSSMSRDEWGRRELVAIHLAGGAEYWPATNQETKENYRQQADQLLHTLATHTGAQIADALETLDISQQQVETLDKS